MHEKIAIQGIKGSFHHEVAQACFGLNADVDECLSFPALVQSLLSGQSSAAVMAIENSIAGAILPNYTLIDKHGLHITGEHYLNISQNLMTLPGQALQDIQEVHSHPMALLQCMDFLEAHPNLKLVEDKDTAETARRIANGKIYGVAAIASRSAATMYGLNILAPNIQSMANNTTRFVLLRTQATPGETVGKASLRFELPHRPGSLAQVLAMVHEHGLNLTKIQSLPKPETPWSYAFFADVTFASPNQYQQAKVALQNATEAFKELGTYQNQQP